MLHEIDERMLFIFITSIRLERYPLVLKSPSVSVFISGLLRAFTNNKRLVFHLWQASHMPEGRGFPMVGAWWDTALMCWGFKAAFSGGLPKIEILYDSENGSGPICQGKPSSLSRLFGA